MRILSVLGRNGSDALMDRVLGLLRRRCVPVQGVTCGASPGSKALLLHVTVACDDEQVIAKALAQLRRQPDVLSAEDVTVASTRELALITVLAPESDHVRLLALASPSVTRPLETGAGHIVLEVVSSPAAIDSLVAKSRLFGPVAVTRSGALSPVPVPYTEAQSRAAFTSQPD